MSYCTNQGHEDFSGNWDDPRRTPLTNNFLQGFSSLAFFFLFAVSPFPTFDLCLMTSPLFFCFLFTHSFFLFISSIFTPYLPVTPAWDLFPSQKICLVILVGSNTGERGETMEEEKYPAQFSFLAMYQLSWGEKAIKETDIVKIKVKMKNWPLQPSWSASPGNAYILFLVHTFLTTQKELVRVLLCLCIKDPI